MASKKKHRKDVQQPKQQSKVAVPSKTEVKRKMSAKPLLPGRWQINAGIFLFFAIATVILYSGDLHLGFFAVDDPQYVINDPWIKGMNGKNLNFIFSHPYFANYSPLHLFSYMVDYSFGGSNAYTFHLSSNIWAGIVAGFVFLTALALTSNRIIAIAAAALFVVHPTHVEAITWISSRKDLVAAAFALPSLLAYLYYRKGGPKARRWYFLSLLLFALALLGKLSVATFPAVFLAIDYFIEKRPLRRSVIDKIPFIAVAAIIGVVVSSAQPQMGNKPDGFVLLQAAVQNLWLLTGLGNYVLYRPAPSAGGAGMEIAGLILLLGLFVLPFFLRKRLPFVAVLIYWMLFAFIPSQVLSFTHPVTDRYLFFPSVAIVILIAWASISFAQQFGQKAIIAAIILMAILAFFWTNTTLNYLKEWKDPRSVWYAATKKSGDPAVPKNLGSAYMRIALGLGNAAQQGSLPKEELVRIANTVWENDPRLPKLLAEWSAGQQGGPMEIQFKDQILSLSWEALESSLRLKGNHIMGDLFYNRGLVLLAKNDLAGAKKEFLAAVDETAKETYADTRNELTVYCYSDLGIISYKQNDYNEALKWFRLADERQKQAGGNWMPTVGKTIKQLEDIVAPKTPR